MLEIYIQEIEGGATLQIPMAPEKIQVDASTRFLSYEIMNSGEHRIPLGEELTGFRWHGILPGEKRQGAPYIQAWKDPNTIQGRFSIWRNRGKKLKLTVPGTPINHSVYLVSYSCEYAGAMGDIEYDIEFCVAKEVVVLTESQSAAQSGTLAAVTTKTPTAKAPAAKTYTVKSGDSLWKIAQSTLGSGSRWQEIYNLNKSTIGSNPNRIYPGQVFNLPAA